MTHHHPQRKTVGILGGKGPEATVELFRLIVAHTPVTCEEDHLRVVIDNHPQIPKCALGITGDGADSLPALTESACLLERAGADVIVIPCNSAHYYLPPLRKAVHVPFLSMIDATVAAVRDAGCSRIGLLATTGLVRAELYQAAFQQAGITPLVPEEAEQEEMMTGILAFKDRGERGELENSLDRICERLVNENGAEAIVLACTELPLVLQRDRTTVPRFDTLAILAKAAVTWATECRPSSPA